MKRRAIKIMFLSMLIVVMIFSSNKYAATKRTLGDINKDNVVDTRDQLLIMRHIMASARKIHPEWILTGDKLKLADVTKNGRVDNSDMLIILRYISAKRNPDTIGKKRKEWLELGKIEEKVKATRITLNKTSVSLDMSGTKTATLIATIAPADTTDKTVTWSSSNTKIATVDSKGKVTAKGNGTATVTAKTVNGKEVTANIRVTTSVTSVTLNKTSVNLDMSGTKTVQLTATVKPDTATNKIITWSSGNTNIATVDSKGKVTAKGNGKVKIIAKTSNENTVRCTVTVTTSPTKIKLNKDTVVLYTVINPKTNTLTATITPKTASNKTVTWSSSNTNIATVDKNGKITAKKAGTVTITAKTSNSKKATCKVKVNTIDPLKWEQNEKVYTDFIAKNRKQVEKEQHNLLIKKDSKAKNFNATIASNKKYWKTRKDWRKNTVNNKSKLSYLIKATNTTDVRSTTFSSCAGWVHVTFRNAGIGYYTARGAYELCEMWCLSSDRSELKPGMIIAVTTHGNRNSKTAPARIYGHVGIYVGNGKVRHFSSWKGKALKYGVRETTLDEWIKTYGDLVTPKWGWMGGIELENDMSKTIKY